MFAFLSPSFSRRSAAETDLPWRAAVCRVAVVGMTLVMMVGCVAYAGYRVAAHNNWIIVTSNSRYVEAGEMPSLRHDDRAISLVLIGDTGQASHQRQQVVREMSRQWPELHADGVVLLGDNFYENGVTSVEDERFEEDFELAFPVRPFNVPFFACLGNHDYHGDVSAQVEYSGRSDRWRMPRRFYRTRFTAGDTTLDLFVLDTNTIDSGEDSAEQQLRWLESALARSTATWRIVVGHHPCLSGGKHGGSDRVARKLVPLLGRYDVALYVSGHDHDLQLLDSGQGWWQVVSGSGSKLRSTRWTEASQYAAAAAGFAWLVVDRQSMSVSFIGKNEHLFTGRRHKRQAMPNLPDAFPDAGVLVGS